FRLIQGSSVRVRAATADSRTSNTENTLMRIASIVVATVVALPLAAGAQGSDTLSMSGRSIIALGFGLTGSRSETTGLGTVSAPAAGQVGSLSFPHWVRPSVAVEISAAVMNADQTVNGGFVHDNAVLPILFGLSMSPQSWALSRSIRPFVSVAAGPYIH